MERVLRVTVGRCIGCGKCELACAFGRGQGRGQGDAQQSPSVHVERRGPERGIPLLCLQCSDAGCIAACPTQALVRSATTDAIELRRERCVGCRMCIAACPFGNIVWHAEQGPEKCDLCGGAPRCATFCPTGALSYTASGRQP